MIERVARVLATHFWREDRWAGTDANQQEDFKKAARAAIEAMRELTEAMDEKGAIFSDSNAATHTWQAMIDEALK